MSKKAKQYSASEKTKIVIEAIKSELTIAQISSKYGVHSTQIHAWKKRGMESLINGFQNKAKVKDPDNQELIKKLYEQIGQLSFERDWLKKNLRCLDLESRKNMIDSTSSDLSIARQCDLLSISKSTYYYKQRGLSKRDLEIMKVIDEIYTEHPYFGARRMAKHLEPYDINIGRKAVSRYYKIMAIEAVYPKMNLSKRNQVHKVYPYLLRDREITRVNQVWSADITYIRMAQGFVYLVAIIGWYSRYILSWRISISLEADKVKQEEFHKQYIKLMSELPTNAVVEFADGVHPTMATKISYGWIRTGHDKLISTTASKTRMNLFGSINLNTMSLTIDSYDTINSDTIEKHFKKLKDKYPPGTEIHLILDRGSYNTSIHTKSAAEENGITLHYLPPYSPNLNPIERLWKVMNEYVRNNTFFASTKDFKSAILPFFYDTWMDIKDVMRSRINDNFQTL